MAAHSSILAWRIPWTEERGRLYSMGSQRVGHDWATSVSLCMKCSLGISNFLEEISSVSHSIVFLYSLHWSLRRAFLSLLAILWNSKAFKCLYLSFSHLLFASLLFTAICKSSSDNHFAFLQFFFLGMVLIPVSCTMSRICIHSSSGTLSIRSNPLNLFFTSTV